MNFTKIYPQLSERQYKQTMQRHNLLANTGILVLSTSWVLSAKFIPTSILIAIFQVTRINRFLLSCLLPLIPEKNLQG